MAIEIVDFPINSMVIFHGKMLVHQRVTKAAILFVHSPSQPDSWPRGKLSQLESGNFFDRTQWAKLSAAMFVYHGVSQHLIKETG